MSWSASGKVSAYKGVRDDQIDQIAPDASQLEAGGVAEQVAAAREAAKTIIEAGGVGGQGAIVNVQLSGHSGEPGFAGSYVAVNVSRVAEDVPFNASGKFDPEGELDDERQSEREKTTNESSTTFADGEKFDPNDAKVNAPDPEITEQAKPAAAKARADAANVRSPKSSDRAR